MSETRKIQKIGNTLYISIPKSWANQLRLKQGEKVTLVTQQDGSVSIYPKTRETRPREITLKVNHKNSTKPLNRGIIAAYLDGYDTIELKTEPAFTEDQHESIREITNSLFGLEIIEVTSNTITIECLLKQKMPIDKTINRIHNVIMSMFSETISALETQSVYLIKGLARRTEDFKRLSLVTNRLLRSIILFPRPSQTEEISLIDCVDYLQILHITAEITENLKKIADCIIPLIGNNLPRSIMKVVIEISAGIKNLYNNSIQALLTKDILLANDILDTSFNLANLWNGCLKANEESKISSLILANIRVVIDSLEHILQHTHEIANISIDRAEAAATRTLASDLTSKARHPIFGRK
jgi:AbrB family looped-hinge helix DNA binding protein